MQSVSYRLLEYQNANILQDVHVYPYHNMVYSPASTTFTCFHFFFNDCIRFWRDYNLSWFTDIHTNFQLTKGFSWYNKLIWMSYAKYCESRASQQSLSPPTIIADTIPLPTPTWTDRVTPSTQVKNKKVTKWTRGIFSVFLLNFKSTSNCSVSW